MSMPRPWAVRPATMTGMRLAGAMLGAPEEAMVPHSMKGKMGRIQDGTMPWMVNCGRAKRKRY